MDNVITKKRIIAIITDHYHPFQAATIAQISSDLAKENYGCICVAGRELHDTDTEQKPHAICNAIYQQINHWGICGAICFTGALGQSIDTKTLKSFLHQFDIPLVSVGMDIPDIASVYLNETRGMQDLMDHLVSQPSRQRFAFVSGYESDIFSLERKQIFMDTLNHAGFDASKMHYLVGQFNPFDTYHAVSELLERNEIDCIVAANDVMAASAARAAKAKGLTIPQDIAITGFDDTPESVGHSPAITTVRQNISKKGHISVQILLKLISQLTAAKTPSDLSVCLPADLIVRRSTQADTVSTPEHALTSQEKLMQELLTRMHGLEKPTSVSYEHITQLVWDAFDQGSIEVMSYANSVSANEIARQSHWWFNLAEQILSITEELPSASNAEKNSAIVISATSIIKEKIWSFEMDNQFEAHRLQNERSDFLLSLSSSNDENDLLQEIGIWLKHMNPKRCFVVQYRHRGKKPHKKAFLNLSYRNQNIELIGSIEFDSEEILPPALQEELQNGLLILNPLYSDDNLYGYLLVDPTDLKLIYTAEAAQSIGNAMRTHYNIKALQEQTNSLEQANFELAHLANYDALTGLANRLKFQQYLEDFCNNHTEQSDDLGIALLFIDLDGFKLINDTLGHASGDLLLNHVAQRLTKIVENTDDYTGFISRLGGDEFTIILHPNSIDSDIHKIANAIIESLSDAFVLGQQSVNISASIGCVFYPKDAVNAFNLVQHADIAMYKAKQNGKNTVAFFSPELINEDSHSLDMAQQLREALTKEQLVMHFQPRIDVKTGKLVSVEALMRWFSQEDPSTVYARPDQFVPLAEKMGLASNLDTYALRYSCRQAASWVSAGHPLVVSVNVSVNQLQQDNFVETVKDVLLEFRLDPSLIELEITESAAVTDVENTIQKLLDLRELGIRFSIDDFGTGYSSLSYLKRLPIDNIKIDRSFIMDIDQSDGGDSADATIVRTIVALGKSMGFRLVAEGIETVEQALFVESLDCDEIQGFLYSRPVSADDITEHLKSKELLFDLHKNRAA